MKKIALILMLLFSFFLNAQNTITLLFSDGFIEDTCKIRVYNNSIFGHKTEKEITTYTTVITSSLETGVADEVIITYPKANKKTYINFEVNKYSLGLFSFDKIKNNSILIIDYVRDHHLRNIALYKNSQDSIAKLLVEQSREFVNGRTKEINPQHLNFQLYQKIKPKFH